jgi:hypothetical protein
MTKRAFVFISSLSLPSFTTNHDPSRVPPRPKLDYSSPPLSRVRVTSRRVMPSQARERAGAGEAFDRAPRWMIARAIGAVVVPVSIAMALCVWLVTLLRDDASREVVSGSVVSAVYTETVRRR